MSMGAASRFTHTSHILSSHWTEKQAVVTGTFVRDEWACHRFSAVVGTIPSTATSHLNPSAFLSLMKANLTISTCIFSSQLEAISSQSSTAYPQLRTSPEILHMLSDLIALKSLISMHTFHIQHPLISPNLNIQELSLLLWQDADHMPTALWISSEWEGKYCSDNAHFKPENCQCLQTWHSTMEFCEWDQLPAVDFSSRIRNCIIITHMGNNRKSQEHFQDS